MRKGHYENKRVADGTYFNKSVGVCFRKKLSFNLLKIFNKV